MPGSQVPESYLLLTNDTGIFTDPVDGSEYSDDTNLSDGTARVNVLYSANNYYTFSGLASSTTYYFKIYPYNGNSGQNNYKTDGLVPTINVQTTSTGGGNLTICLSVNMLKAPLSRIKQLKYLMALLLILI